MCSQPLERAPRYGEASIAAVSEARYDGLAEWFDREFATSELGLFGQRAGRSRVSVRGGDEMAAMRDPIASTRLLRRPPSPAT